MANVIYDIEIYVAKSTQQPFIKWLESLDERVRYRVKERLDRVRLGNLGDHKSLGGGLYELRLSFGSGYRIYYGQIENKIVLLLTAGDKSTQKKDILKAKSYLLDYLSR